MDFGGESVGVVPQGVLDRAEDLFGRRVGECLGHPARASLEERLEAFHQLPDAGLAVVARCGRGAVGVGHDGSRRRGFAPPTTVWPIPQRFAPTLSGRTPSIEARGFLVLHAIAQL